MSFTRNCPDCGKEIIYTNKNNCRSAELKHSKCFECGIKNRRNYSGENNPFFGQKHTNQTKQIISTFNSEIRVLSDEFLDKAKMNLAKVTNSRPLYEIWLEKFGKEVADQKLQSFKDKQSKNNSGTNNHMYGKPAPQGSGNGWSGWYKDWYFRSLRELSYMINVIEKENLQWRCPNNDFKISYQDYKGDIKTYFPDFIINEIKVVEIKPKKLHNTPKVLAKKLAAEEFCKSQNMTYELIDPIILSDEEIKVLYISGQIKFLDKYDKKFKERFMNNA